jgi:hypothetical protein
MQSNIIRVDLHPLGHGCCTIYAEGLCQIEMSPCDDDENSQRWHFMICDILAILRKRGYPFHSVDGVVLVQGCLHQPPLQQKLKVVGSESRSARLTGSDVRRYGTYCKIEERKQTAG